MRQASVARDAIQEQHLTDWLKSPILGLCGLAVVLLLYGTRLPQHGDGAIGTLMIYAASLGAYALMLILALPAAVRAWRRGHSMREAGWLCGAIVAPMATWLAVIWWLGLS